MEGDSDGIGESEGASFRVLGAGAVYVVDGGGISYSSLSERHAEGVLTICGVTLHVLGEGDAFDLTNRRPLPKAEEKEKG